MYVYLNHVDYEGMVDGLVYHYQLQDSPIHFSAFSPILKHVANRLGCLNRLTISCANKEKSSEFAKLYIEYTKSNIFPPDPDMILPDMVKILETPMSESGTLLQDQIRTYFSAFFPVVDDDDGGKVLLVDQDMLAVELNDATTLLDKYELLHVSELELLIEQKLVSALGPDLMDKLIFIDVIDSPGKTVKYGDSLVTFPLILARIEDYECQQHQERGSD